MSNADRQTTSASKLARALDSMDYAIAKLEELIMAIGVILMAVNTIANVISRFIFNHSIIFAEELNSSFILLVTFAGMGYAARHGRHIRMSAIYDAMPHGTRKLMMTIIVGVTAVLMLFLAYFSIQYVAGVYAKGRIMPALGIPVYVIYLWVPVGFLITGIQFTLTAIKNLQSKEIYLSTGLKEQEAQEIEV